MPEITKLCLTIAGILIVVAIAIYYAQKDVDIKQDMKQIRNEQGTTQKTIDDEQEKYFYLMQRIKHLEEENERLKQQLEEKYYIPRQQEKDNTLLWLVIIGLVAFLVYQAVQLNEYNQIKGLLESIF